MKEDYNNVSTTKCCIAYVKRKWPILQRTKRERERENILRSWSGIVENCFIDERAFRIETDGKDKGGETAWSGYIRCYGVYARNPLSDCASR